MPETQWYDRRAGFVIKETVGTHTPQTPLLIKEYGDCVDGISRGYERKIAFTDDPMLIYMTMFDHWREIVPENYRTVWTGYTVEPDFLNGSGLLYGHIVKGWFFCYRIRADHSIGRGALTGA
jgi:hypothetical protein